MIMNKEVCLRDSVIVCTLDVIEVLLRPLQ